MKQAKLLLSSFFLLTTFCTSAQNVGIGTSAPLKILHVQQGGTSFLNSAFGNGMIFSTNSASGARIFMENLGGPVSQKTMVLINENVSGQGTTYFGSLAYDGSTFISPSILSMNHTSGNVGIGTKTPDAKLQIAGGVKIEDSLSIGGQVRITSGTPGAGKVLTSDATGLASWTTPAAAGSHYIGESYGGGIIFYITPNALHGLIAETQDQGISSWYDVQDSISIIAYHSAAGQNFADWRTPTKNELNLLWGQSTLVGGFVNGIYWSSIEFADTPNSTDAWYQSFNSGNQDHYDKRLTFNVRAVRAF